MKLYDVKEVCKYSGLNRKELFVLEKSIPPAARKDNAGYNSKGEIHKGYKQYDQEGLEKLCLAALFRKLGVELSTINTRFSSGETNKTDLFDELIKQAYAEKQKAEDIITVASAFKLYDWEKITFNPLNIEDLHGLAMRIRKELNSDATKNSLSNMNETKEEALFEIYRGFEGYPEDDFSSPEIEQQIDKLKDFAQKNLEISPSLFLSNQVVALSSIKEFSYEVERKTTLGLTSFISEAIFSYQCDHFFDDAEETINNIESHFNQKTAYSEIGSLIKDLVYYIDKWFGYKNVDDIKTILQSLSILFTQDEEMENDAELMNYIFNAIIYLTENSESEV